MQSSLALSVPGFAGGIEPSPNLVPPPVGASLLEGGRAWQGPEEAGASIEHMLLDPATSCKWSTNQMRSIVPVEGYFTLLSTDYGTILNNDYFNGMVETMNALGRNDQRNYPFITAGAGTGAFSVGTGTSPDVFLSGPNLIAGLLINWSMKYLDFSQFTMTIQTTGFRGFGWQILDRSLSLRVEASQRGASGLFYLPLVQRQTAGMTCGYTASSVAGGGMSQGVLQPAVIPILVSNLDSVGGPDGNGFNDLPPFFNSSGASMPITRITIPANLEDSFTASLQLVTTGSMALQSARKAWMTMQAADRGIPQNMPSQARFGIGTIGLGVTG